jgi:hypothetical protein
MLAQGLGVERYTNRSVLPNACYKFVVERGPIGQMMHAGYNRWMAGRYLTHRALDCSFSRMRFTHVLPGDQESALSHYITAGVAGLEIAQVRCIPCFALSSRIIWACPLPIMPTSFFTGQCCRDSHGQEGEFAPTIAYETIPFTHARPSPLIFC